MLWWTLRQLRSKNPETRRQAAQKLGQSRNVQAVEPLVALLGDKDALVWAAATQALVQIGPAVVEPLVTALRGEDADVRWAAAQALVQIGPAAVEPLVTALQEAPGMGREVAAHVLGQCGWQPANDTQRVLYAVARRRWEDAVRLGAAAVEPLMAVLGEEHGVGRGVAAQALGDLGDARAVAPLVAALQDSNAWVREAAAQALGQVGDEHAVKALVTLATIDEDCAGTAIRALQRLLEQSASRLASKDLRTVAQLKHVVQWQYSVDSCGTYHKLNREVLDCSSVKQLAQQELIRRGLKA